MCAWCGLRLVRRRERSTAADSGEVVRSSSEERYSVPAAGKEYEPRLLYEQVHVGIPRSPYPPTVVNALLAH